jgi:hypothetical protein
VGDYEELVIASIDRVETHGWVVGDTDVWGPSAPANIYALTPKACSGLTVRSWSNQGHGEAWHGATYFNGPTETATTSLACG